MRHLLIPLFILLCQGCFAFVTPPLRLSASGVVAGGDPVSQPAPAPQPTADSMWGLQAELVPQTWFENEFEREFELSFGYGMGCPGAVCLSLRHGPLATGTWYHYLDRGDVAVRLYTRAEVQLLFEEQLAMTAIGVRGALLFGIDFAGMTAQGASSSPDGVFFGGGSEGGFSPALLLEAGGMDGAYWVAGGFRLSFTVPFLGGIVFLR